jgi:hypothetical protein
MIFGKTNKAKKDIEQAKLREMIRGEKKFALFPAKLKDGSYIWLDYYYSYYFGGVDQNGELFLWHISSDSNSVCHNNHASKNIRHIRMTEPVPGKPSHNFQEMTITEDHLKSGRLLGEDI